MLMHCISMTYTTPNMNQYKLETPASLASESGTSSWYWAATQVWSPCVSFAGRLSQGLCVKRGAQRCPPATGLFSFPLYLSTCLAGRPSPGAAWVFLTWLQRFGPVCGRAADICRPSHSSGFCWWTHSVLCFLFLF